MITAERQDVGQTIMTILRAILVAFSMLLVGCGGGDCPRSSIIEISYPGSKSGVPYWREIWLPSGTVLGAAGGGAPVQGPMQATEVSRACWDSTAAGNVSGFAIEAWMDTDGDDADACRAGLFDRVRCAPDLGEPQVLQDYTALARGETRVSVVMKD